MKKKNLKQNRQRLTVIPGEGRRFSFATVKQALVFYILLLIALVVIVQLGYHWLGGQFLAWRLQVVEAEMGIMQQELTINGIVTRQEEIIRAPASGILLNLVVEGERAPIGAELATIGVLSRSSMEALRGSEEVDPDQDLWDTILDYWHNIFPYETGKEAVQGEELNQNEDADSDQDNGSLESGAADNRTGEPVIVQGETVFEELLVIYNERPGFVSNFIDGWENHSGPIYKTQEELEENIYDGAYILEGDLVNAGEPILKIIDNWRWFFSVVLPLHPGSTIAEMQTVDIKFAFAPGEPVKAERHNYEIDQSGRQVLITYVIGKQFPGFDLVRQTEATLIYRRQQGIIVPAEAVFKKEDEEGVFLNQGGRVIFQPVNVIEKQEDKVMVDGIVPFSLVISRPELVEEGQRLN